MIYKFLNDSKLIIIAVILFICASTSINAVGIQGTYSGTLLFEPNKEHTFTFGLFGAENIGSFLDGDLAEYATITDNAPDSGPRSVSIKLKFPETLSPGFHYLYLGAREIAANQGTVGGLAIAKVRIQVLSLYPGKYPEYSLAVKDLNVGEMGKAYVSVTNYGTETIYSAQAAIELFDPEGKSITTIYTDTDTIGSNGNKQLEATIDSSRLAMAPGIYKAVAKLTYDGITLDTIRETTFMVGSMKILITGTTKEVFVNSTNKYTISVESDWTGEIKDVYAKIKTPNGKELKTPNIDLVKPDRNNVKATGILETYWETNGLDFGEYDMIITLYYNKLSSQETAKVTIIPGIAPVIEEPKSFSVIGYENGKIILFNVSIPVTIFLMIILACIVTFNLYYFILRKDNKNQGQAVNVNNDSDNMSNSADPSIKHESRHEQKHETLRPPSR